MNPLSLIDCHFVNFNFVIFIRLSSHLLLLAGAIDLLTATKKRNMKRAYSLGLGRVGWPDPNEGCGVGWPDPDKGYGRDSVFTNYGGEFSHTLGQMINGFFNKLPRYANSLLMTFPTL